MIFAFDKQRSTVDDIQRCFETIEEAEKFAEWAFGSDFRTINLQHKAHLYWNELHGNKLRLLGSGRPADDLQKMIQLFKSSM